MIRAIESDPRFMELLQERGFACELYGALTNMHWTHTDGRTNAVCADQWAGSIVADLRDEGEDHQNFCGFSCSGVVSERVGRELARLGWTGTVMP